MKIITRYIGTTVVTYILIVVLLLLGLHAFLEFTYEFRDLGTGYYGLLQALTYVPLVLPSDVYQFFPMAGLLGSVIGLGLLASHSELIVMRSSGVSLANIVWSVLKAALILVVIMMLIGEIVAPYAKRVATENKAIAMSGGQTLVTKHGVWVHNKNNYVHIESILPEGKLQGITRYVLNGGQQAQIASYAESAEFHNGQWVFKNIQQTNFGNNTTTKKIFSEQEFGFNLNPRLIGLSQIDTDQKSLPELRTYIKDRKQSGLDTRNYRFAFWQRIFQPLATLVMILLAIPFVFGPLRTVTMGLRMLTGVLVGFCFYILNQFVGPMSVVYQVPPVLAAILPSLIFAALGGFMVLKS